MKFIYLFFIIFLFYLVKCDTVVLNMSDPNFQFVRCDHGHTPDVVDDCTRFQTETSSCCYFTYGETTSCIYLGIRYLGSGQYGDLYIECKSNFVNFNKCIIPILMIILL